MAKVMNLLALHTRALHADNIQPTKMGMHADCHTVGNEIAHNRSHSPNKGMMPNAYKLMDRCSSTQNGMMADSCVTANHHIVGECDVIADIAIMRHMGISQK